MIEFNKFKNILIVNSRAGKIKHAGQVMWGSWAVASHLQKAYPQAKITFLDENNEDDFLRKYQTIAKEQDAVGFSVSSMQIQDTLPLVVYLRKNYPRIKTFVGGIHPTLFPNQDYGNLFDYIITEDLPKNYFDYNLLPKKVKKYFSKKRAEIVTGFNCSYKCTFCINSTRNCHYESIPIKNILENIDYTVKEFNPKKVYFRDEDFFQDIKKAEAIINHIKEKKYTFRWEANSRVNHFNQQRINEALLEKMRETHCSQIRFGIESGSQRVLNYLQKGQNLKQIRFAVRQCIKYGLGVACSFIFGLPTETAQEREETYKLISELSGYDKKVLILGPQIYRPYPGGKLFDEAKKYGLKFPEKFIDWPDYFKNSPAGDILDIKSTLPWLSKKENNNLPYVWVVAHYGLNYSKANSLLKKMIGYWFLMHWKFRWFSGLDIKFFRLIKILHINIFKQG
ncbi:B12-binding domain-containing radical SAM protein [Candidatus Margulisiibacteriota bacterium]